MKFVTTLLTFIAASSISTVYAQYDPKADALAYKNCNEALKEYALCLKKPIGNIANEVCQTVQSEKCQKFYNDPFTFVPVCKKDSVTSDLLHPILMNYSKQAVLLACKKDEAGNSCPFSEFALEKKFVRMTDEEIKKAKENTCKSNSCREATINAFTDIQTTRAYCDQKIALGHIRKEVAALMEEVAQYLNSAECKPMNTNANQGSTTSGNVNQGSTTNGNVNQGNTISGNANQGNTINGNANQGNTTNINANQGGAMNGDTKQENNSVDNNTSNASTIKMVNGVLISLCLILLSIY